MSNYGNSTNSPVFSTPSTHLFSNGLRDEGGRSTKNPFKDAARQNNKEFGKDWEYWDGEPEDSTVSGSNDSQYSAD